MTKSELERKVIELEAQVELLKGMVSPILPHTAPQDYPTWPQWSYPTYPGTAAPPRRIDYTIS